MKSIACARTGVELQILAIEKTAIFSHLRKDNQTINKGVIALLIKLIKNFRRFSYNNGRFYRKQVHKNHSNS